MKELSIEKMQMVSGGKMNNATQCIGGIVATAALGATAFFAPVAFMGVLMTGAGYTALVYCNYSICLF